MKIEEINRFTLFILMCYCIYTVFMFNKKLTKDIQISETKLEVLALEKESKLLNIEIDKEYFKKVKKL